MAQKFYFFFLRNGGNCEGAENESASCRFPGCEQGNLLRSIDNKTVKDNC